MVVNTLKHYPFGEAFDPHRRQKPRALMLPDSVNSMHMLKQKDLEEDKSLKLLAEELHTFYMRETLAVFKPILQIQVQVVQIEIQLPEFILQLLLALFEIRNVTPRSPNPVLPQTEYDAVNEVLFALIHSSCMQVMVNAHLEAVNKLSDADIKKLKELKKKLTNYTAALDEVLQLYTFDSNSRSMTGEMLEKIRKSKAGLRDIIKKMKAGKLKELLPNTKEITPDHILCSVLGIEEECAEWLYKMPEDTRNHQTDEYWVKRYLEDKANMLEDSITETSEEVTNGAGIDDDLASKFIALGFTEHRAAYLKQWVESSGEFQDHQVPLYWAKLYIEDVFKYDILLTDEVPRYPYNPDKKGEWFKQEFETVGRFWDQDDEDSEDETDKGAIAQPGPQSHPVHIINLDGLQDNSFSSESKIKIPPESDDQFWVLYHGTDHRSAKSIIVEGIQFRKSRNNQDFSGVTRKGFYLSLDFEQAKLWTGRRSTCSHSAVLIYKVPKNLLEEFEPNAIDLSNNRDQWKEIVKHCRKDGHVKLGKQTRKEYKTASYIQGPICRNAAQVGKDPPTGFERGKDQVCILDADMAKVVGDLRHMYAVLFF